MAYDLIVFNQEMRRKKDMISNDNDNKYIDNAGKNIINKILLFMQY